MNIWEAKPDLADQAFDTYAPGLHRLAVSADTRERVNEMAALVERLGGVIVYGPGEFPFDVGGYCAMYLLGPDLLKFEFAHMATLADHCGLA